ncbi:hypothetical protein [Paraburkholderia sp. GAS348]|uniref:hypothetical protein n=1 Tax=Paraburkholderia sp. GAS348 TaxID=3035132 RepID=UPI003D225EBB
MVKKNAGKSTLGSFTDLPIEAQLLEDDGAGREAIEARLTAEIGCLNNALLIASPALKKELILLVECLRAARQVVERSASFKIARD